MTMPWTANELEQARGLTIQLFLEGQTPSEIAPLLGVSVRSVQRWIANWDAGGEQALLTRPRSGRPAKLTLSQKRQVLHWVAQRSPTAFGFASERWTAPRVALLIAQRFGVTMNHRYLNDWLRRHGPITPQVPERKVYQRDELQIHAWMQEQWPRVKKTPDASVPLSHLLTKAASCWCP
jgi:transposase